MTTQEENQIQNLPAEKPNKAKSFVIGQELSTRSVCDYDCSFKATVLSRTAKFVTVKLENVKEPKRCKVSIYEDVETIMPLGRYSMAM